jgi:beta-propeller repeat-containing protein
MLARRWIVDERFSLRAMVENHVTGQGGGPRRIGGAVRVTVAALAVSWVGRLAFADEPPGGRAVLWTLAGARPVPSPDPPSDGRLRYEEVYPGVSLTLQSRRHAVMYRFDVAPGGAAEAIRMRYEGADELVAEDSGASLRACTGSRCLRERGLRCFQEQAAARHDVACSYQVQRSGEGAYEVALLIGPYDRARPLVIDPEISWSSYLGGDSPDRGTSIAVDGAGNAYVTGETYSTDFPSTGGFDTSYSGGGPDVSYPDAFVTKIGRTGTLLWSSYLGGAGSDQPYGIGVDAAGNAFVAGATWSSDFPTPGGFDTTLGGETDAFVTKVSATGALLWSSYLGGEPSQDGGFGQDEVFGIAVDPAGDAFVTGETSSSDFPTSAGLPAKCFGRTFVTKISPEGSLVWSSCPADVQGRGIAVDGSGNAYVTGFTGGSALPLIDAFDTSRESWEGFVFKLDSGGSLVWSSYLGWADADFPGAIALDAAGNAYVAGYTTPPSDPYAGDGDAFVVKVSSTGSFQWASYFDGSADDHALGIAVDRGGNSYVTGYTDSTDFPSAGGFDTDAPEFRDAFVVKLDTQGSLLWSSYLGGNSNDEGHGVAVDASGNPHLTGETWSTDFPTPGGFDTSARQCDINAFVTRIDACGLDACGNGCCGPGEDRCTCPADCAVDVCGDGCCTGSEDACTCSADCGADTCGNGCCGPAEDQCTCPADCGANTCGNGCCGPGEDRCGCPGDCGPDFCGSGCCGPAENQCTCPSDCGADTCNNGCCGPGEDRCGCPGDCGPDFCGSGCCGPAENQCTCPSDCGVDTCGNDCCGPDESCRNCADDCGACPEPGAGPEPLPEPPPGADAGPSPDAGATVVGDPRGPTDTPETATPEGCACDVGRPPGSLNWLWILAVGIPWARCSRRRYVRGGRRGSQRSG